MKASTSILVVVLAALALLVALLAMHNRAHNQGEGLQVKEAGTATSPTLGTGKALAESYVVELGDPRCPHCRAMEEFLKTYSGETGVRAFFCPVTNKVCGNAFWRLYRLGATQGVPTIVACMNGRVGFIEVGELRDRQWWSQHLASMKPVEEGVVDVYLAGRLYKTIEVDKILARELCNTTLAYSKPIS